MTPTVFDTRSPGCPDFRSPNAMPNNRELRQCCAIDKSALKLLEGAAMQLHPAQAPSIRPEHTVETITRVF